MSGGSYDYLAYNEPEKLLENMHNLERMADRLSALGYASDAAQATYRLLSVLRQFNDYVNMEMGRLNDVWHNVEWWDSGDSGEEDVKTALDKYRSPILPKAT